MKKNILHRFLPSCIVLLLSFFLPGFANAQSGCGVTITSDKDNNGILNNASPYLAPNPASDIVSVYGYEGNIVDIVVMDMNGRHMASIDNTDSFDVADLTAGMYIVRVRTRNNYGKDNVVYLRFIKE